MLDQLWVPNHHRSSRINYINNNASVKKQLLAAGPEFTVSMVSAFSMIYAICLFAEITTVSRSEERNPKERSLEMFLLQEMLLLTRMLLYWRGSY